MTQKQIDAAWRSLPEDYKVELRRKYKPYIALGEVGVINTEILLLEDLFGKHNLTASKEEKPKMMSKEKLRLKFELADYAVKNRKKLEAQEVTLGAVVMILVGQFAGEKGIVKGIMVPDDDFNYPYYEVDMECEVPDKYKCRKTLISANNVIGGLTKSDFEVIGYFMPSEGRPKFKVGDIVKVSQDMKWGNGESDKNKEILLNAPSQITEIQGENALLEGAGESVYGLIPLEYLIPYTDEQEPKNDECVVFSSSSPQNRKNLTENEIPSMSKDDAEELAKCLAAVDDFIKEYKASQVDWLAFRMELAKEVVNGLLFTGKSPETIVDETTTIVNGIVEKLKGGLKK